MAERLSWVSIEGVVYGTTHEPLLRLALPAEAKIWRAVATVDALVCVLGSAVTADQYAMAYSLQTGAELWPALVRCDGVVLAGGAHIWIAYPAAGELRTVAVATGDVVETRNLNAIGDTVVETPGAVEACLLRGHLISWVPGRFSAHDASRGDYRTLQFVGTAYDSSRTVQRLAGEKMFAVDPRGGACPSKGVAMVFRRECIAIVDPVTMTVLKKLPAPEIITAWRRTVPQCAAHECSKIADAVAAADELGEAAVDANAVGAVGLVRAVLIGFLAEDARLTALRCAF